MKKLLVVVFSLSMTSPVLAQYQTGTQEVFHGEKHTFIGEYPHGAPDLNESEKRALRHIHLGAFTPDGEQCAYGLTLGHPAVNDLEDMSWNRVSSVEIHAMNIQNARRCECIGDRSHLAIDELPPKEQTVDNIKLFLYSVMSHMALKQHRYYPWGGTIEGFDELTQRYWVENVANYCEAPVSGLLPHGQ